MTAQTKKAKWKGEVDYDFKHDILFFKTKNREYQRSLELDNLILDIDSEGYIVGIQIYEASHFLNVERLKLRDIPNWEFNVKTEQMDQQGKKITKIEFRLVFQVRVRNKLIEKNPIIMPQPIDEKLPNSDLMCFV